MAEVKWYPIYDTSKMITLANVKKEMNNVHWFTGRLLQEVDLKHMDEMEAIHIELQALEQRFLKMLPEIQESFRKN